MVGSFNDLLIEQQLKTTVWVKIPSIGINSWFEEIERYQHQGNAEWIYLCSTKKGQTYSSPQQNSSSKNYQANTKTVPIELQTSYKFQRGIFFINFITSIL